MYLDETIIGLENIKDSSVTCVVEPEFINEHKVEKVEVWGSSFNDPGDDFNEFRFFKKDSTTPFHTLRLNGY